MTAQQPAAIIFRKRLLPWSETFIAAQGSALTRYHPVFVGVRREAGGAAYLDGRDVLTLKEHSRVWPVSRALFSAAGWMPHRWLEAMRERRPAIVHAHFGFNARQAMRVARALRVPLVVTFHGSDIAKDRSSRGGDAKRQRVFAGADRIIAVSGFIRRLLMEAGAPPDRTVLHHIGVDTSRFTPGDPDRRTRTVLFVGRLVTKKGLPHLLGAMRSVQDEMPAAELVIVGDGPRREEAQAQAQQLDVRVEWLGVQSPARVAELMRTSALLCVPSIESERGDAEGLPMTVVEAQASGLPVVAFPSGGTAEGIDHGTTGYVLPSGDEEALAAHLLTLLRDDELRARYSRAARDHVLRNFDLHRQTARLEEIYDQVIAERTASKSPGSGQ